MALKDLLTEIALKWGYKMNEQPSGYLSLDIPIRKKDGTSRFQYLTVREEELVEGERRYYITSQSGIVSDKTNYYEILKDAGSCNYSAVTILTSNGTDGQPVYYIGVQAAPLVEHTSKELLDAIIFEVAFYADRMEEKHFGSDQY